MLEMLRRKSDGRVFLAVDDNDGGIACLLPVTVTTDGAYAAFDLPPDEMYPGLVPFRRDDFESWTPAVRVFR